MIAGSYAGHVSGNRKQFANILSKAAPYVFLPFFTLTGVSLQLDEVAKTFPLAMFVFSHRVISILIASYGAGRLYLDALQTKWLWLTLLSQAGVALGLAFEVRERFPAWGGEFTTLILSVVVLNQLFGPPLCKVGLKMLGTFPSANDNPVESKLSDGEHYNNFGTASLEHALLADNEDMDPQSPRASRGIGMPSLQRKDTFENSAWASSTPTRSLHSDRLPRGINHSTYQSIDSSLPNPAARFFSVSPDSPPARKS